MNFADDSDDTIDVLILGTTTILEQTTNLLFAESLGDPSFSDKDERILNCHRAYKRKYEMPALNTFALFNSPRRIRAEDEVRMMEEFSDRERRAVLGVSNNMIRYLYDILCKVDNGLNGDWNWSGVEFLERSIHILGVDPDAEEGLLRGDPLYNNFYIVNDIVQAINSSAYELSELYHETGKRSHGTDNIPVWTMLFSSLMFLRGYNVVSIQISLRISIGSFYKYIYKVLTIFYLYHCSQLKFPFPVTPTAKAIFNDSASEFAGAGLPGCIGAMDGWAIPIIVPSNDTKKK